MGQNKKAVPFATLATLGGSLAGYELYQMNQSDLLGDILATPGIILLGWMVFYVIRKRVVAHTLKAKNSSV
jgi:hypothetical protein